MIVDDSASLRNAIRELLTLYEDIELIAETGDGKEAVDLALSCQPDVVLMDVNMPSMNGIEAARWIKSSWNDISIIGLCGMRDSYTMEAFHRAGASASISKNTLSQLHAVIKGACCHKAHARGQ